MRVRSATAGGLPGPPPHSCRSYGAWLESGVVVTINMALLTELALASPSGSLPALWPTLIPRSTFRSCSPCKEGRAWFARNAKRNLQKYMTGIVSRQGQKLIAIHCMPDHTHVLIGLRPNIALSDLVGDIKTGSTNHINEQRWVPGRFSWQEGFGAFSYSHSQLKGVIDYIRDQVKHHARKTFRQEYLAFLKKYEVPHDERYIFRPVDEE